VIKENLFSFYMERRADGAYASFIDIGAVNEDHLKKPNSLIWFDVREHMFWMNDHTTAIRFGDDDRDAYHFTTMDQSMVSIFDSGTSMVFVPKSLWSLFFEKVKAAMPQLSFSRQGQYYATDCNFDGLPSIYLMMQGYWVEILPTDYLIDGTKPDSDKRYQICTLGFISNSDDYWLLGDVFMRGYYTTFDNENSLIGIAPHSNSIKKQIKLATVEPSKLLTDGQWTIWWKIGLAALIIVGIAAIALICIFAVPPFWSWIKRKIGGDTSSRKAQYSKVQDFTDDAIKLIIIN